ncbi:MAG TPA: DUF2937 family protein [Stellaceae bacterium]|nr:DUF2937 family protein [Stellaceae bacterium]
MRGFLKRWLGQSLTIALALAGAILLMQAPALTSEYAAALLQVAQEARRDVDQREASARRFYSITAEDDAGLLAALGKVEPSNAETLARSIDKARALQRAHDVIEGQSPLLRPLAALIDQFDDPGSDKRAIGRTLLAAYEIQLAITVAAAVYGLAGLLAGSFLAQLILALGRGAALTRI